MDFLPPQGEGLDGFENHVCFYAWNFDQQLIRTSRLRGNLNWTWNESAGPSYITK